LDVEQQAATTGIKLNASKSAFLINNINLPKQS